MAVAGERLGIGIQRHFTSESAIPTMRCLEHRDSRISDYRTGAVAFEQLGVEVPSTWSLNATNILAQKYFRARSACPAGNRRSAKLSTCRRHDHGMGLKTGTSSTRSRRHLQRRAQALVVQQKAAFNSPVCSTSELKVYPSRPRRASFSV